MTDLIPQDIASLSPMQKAEKLMKLAELKKQVTDAYNQMRDDLLKVCQDLDVYSLKTGSYTITRSKRITPEVTDFLALKESLDKNQIPYKTKTVFADYMQTTFKQLIDTGTSLPGLEGKETEYVSVRVAKPKEE